MGKYDNLSDKELLKALLRISPETLKELGEIDKVDVSLLTSNLQELESFDENKKRYKHGEKYTLEELKFFLSQPLSEADIKRMKQMDNDSQGLLALNFQIIQSEDDDFND